MLRRAPLVDPYLRNRLLAELVHRLVVHDDAILPNNSVMSVAVVGVQGHISVDDLQA